MQSFAVRGTPTDCVIMGARHVLNGKGPDLVLSGVNRGRNAGEDVIYSGTVAGAVEGTVIGVPSLALSQAYASRSGRQPLLGNGLKYGPDIIRRVIAEGIPRDVLINVNFPDCPPDKVRRIAVSTAGPPRAASGSISTSARTAAAIAYYWIAYVRQNFAPAPDGTDLAAIEEHCISVTPLRLDMTDEPYMTRLAAIFD